MMKAGRGIMKMSITVLTWSLRIHQMRKLIVRKRMKPRNLICPPSHDKTVQMTQPPKTSILHQIDLLTRLLKGTPVNLDLHIIHLIMITLTIPHHLIGTLHILTLTLGEDHMNKEDIIQSKGDLEMVTMITLDEVDIIILFQNGIKIIDMGMSPENGNPILTIKVDLQEFSRRRLAHLLQQRLHHLLQRMKLVLRMPLNHQTSFLKIVVFPKRS